MKWHETPEFQALRREWYDKATASGFKDIEQVIDSKGTVGDLLLGVSTGDLRRRLYKPETEQYYALARQHFHTERWYRKPEGALRRRVWALHMEGYGAKRGMAALREAGVEVTLSRWNRIVADEKARMMRRVHREADRSAKAAIEAWEDDADAP